ncbi:conserved hypothetical protein [Trichinella spiralis]|uniref:hypothetical protein n=1 Tax=Trichinella spiralis TaxID=6334 RepID=UPI0001EFCAC7|nr:conserved hypothetical protein [Trichinella spiralis]
MSITPGDRAYVTLVLWSIGGNRCPTDRWSVVRVGPSNDRWSLTIFWHFSTEFFLVIRSLKMVLYCVSFPFCAGHPVSQQSISSGYFAATIFFLHSRIRCLLLNHAALTFCSSVLHDTRPRLALNKKNSHCMYR